jgi:hypothetical protein
MVALLEEKSFLRDSQCVEKNDAFVVEEAI